VPVVPLFPLVGAALCVWLLTKLEGVTFLRFGIWMAVGLVIHVLYGRRHSRLQRGELDGDGGTPQPAAGPAR